MEKYLYKKYKKNKDFFEFVIQYYMLKKKKRKIFQIQFYKKSKIGKFKKFLERYNIRYKMFDETGSRDNCYRFIFYRKSIKGVDFTFGKKFAKQLGKFYIFGKNNYLDLCSSSHCRISINVSNKYQFGELYAQLCLIDELGSNLGFFEGIVRELGDFFRKLDREMKVFMIISYGSHVGDTSAK